MINSSLETGPFFFFCGLLVNPQDLDALYDFFDSFVNLDIKFSGPHLITKFVCFCSFLDVQMLSN